ncbi:MAG: hypothetical protein EAZ89_11005, partial [Bacteroidetes bacterium]
ECQNGGICEDGTCDCAEGYIGTECATETRARFIDEFRVSETCDNFPGQTFYTPLKIEKSSAGILKVTVINLYKLGWTLPAEIKNAQLSFTNAPVTGAPAGTTATGTGNLSGSTLTVVYYISENGVVKDNCDITASK